MNDSREVILREAFKLFLQKSYREVTIKDIVEKVGMTKGAFYYFFKSKEEIYCEIFNAFFLEIIKIDYSKFSRDSLYDFYHDILRHTENTASSSAQNEPDSNVNLYAFIYDSLKQFPDLRNKIEGVLLSEMDAWESMISSARKNGEIKSILSDKQIASIFIHTSRGMGMDSMIAGQFQEWRKQIAALWDTFYKTLKI